MATLLCLLALSLSQEPSQVDPTPAYRILDQLGLKRKSDSPRLLSYRETNYVYLSKEYGFANHSVSLRADDSLFSYRWDPPHQISTERQFKPQVIPDQKLLQSAKRIVKAMWPKTDFVFGQMVENRDDQRPSRSVMFWPKLRGFQVDDAHSGWMDMDSIGGELSSLLAPDTPLPPTSVEHRVTPDQAESKILWHLVEKYQASFLLNPDRLALRVYSESEVSYQQPSRLVYASDIYSIYYEREEARYTYSNWHNTKIDPLTGALVVDRRAFPGGRGFVEETLPTLSEERFRAIIWNHDRRLNLRNAKFTKLFPLDTPPKIASSRQILLVGQKLTILLRYLPDSEDLLLRHGIQWYKVTPDSQMSKAMKTAFKDAPEN